MSRARPQRQAIDRINCRRTEPGSPTWRRLLIVAGWGVASATSGAVAAEPCGTGSYPFPYTDVSSVGDPFCPAIMEAYVTGVTKGTAPTTFSPNDTVSRVQMTTFLQRSLDEGLRRASRRPALNQWWIPQNANAMQTIVVGGDPRFCAADGENIWITNAGQVVQVQASTGKVLGTWTGATTSLGVLVAAGKVFVASQVDTLYVIDPTQPPGPVAVATDSLGTSPNGIAFDGANIWTANGDGSVSIITPQATMPYPVTTVRTGFELLYGILYDGAHIWVTDYDAGTLLKLDSAGNILQSVPVGSFPLSPLFDGTNIWVPNVFSSITVVQASTGSVVATITADATNLLARPEIGSFDGERVLFTNSNNGSVTLFKAADFSFIANVSIKLGTTPLGACSDGINFWVTLFLSGSLLRF